MKEMVGGCCVCSDDQGWAENPLVYCDGQGCTVAVHQACYGIVKVPNGHWYCRKCESERSRKCDSQERSIKVKCELCPNKEGALKPTDNNAWAHVVCALYIPEVRFGNVTTMEPIILAQIPQERFNKTCYICEDKSRSRASDGACMQCNKAGCRQQFHVTCAQGLGLLCEEASNYMENVKYCGYCHHHYTKLKKGGNVKVIPPYRPVGANDSPEGSPVKETEPTKTTSKRKLSTGSSKSGKTPSTTGEPEPGIGEEDKPATLEGEGSKLVNKRSKGGSRTPPAGQLLSGTSPESSPRANSPGSSLRQATAAIPPPHAVSKESSRQSIVVTVPLDALPNNVASIASPSPPPLPPSINAVPSVGSTSVSTIPVDQAPLPAKRQRSLSSEKSEKGRRWMKRSSSGKSHSPPLPSQHSAGSKSSSPGESSNSQQSSSEGKLRRPASGPGVVIKEEKDVKIFQNGLNAPHMLGNQLNPASLMAQKMCDTLSQEIVAHSLFIQQESNNQTNSLVGPQLHRARHPPPPPQNRIGPWMGMIGTLNSSNHYPTNNNNNNPAMSLEHLLERQWEQGSQFIMEQAQHFDKNLLERQGEQGSELIMEESQHVDIASLLSCLHQLRSENAQLEDHITSLVQRRDHLLAVNARLAVPLVIPLNPQAQPVNNVAASTPPVNSSPAIVENGIATAAEQVQYQRNTPQPLPRSNSAGFPGNGQQMQQQNSVVVRASSADQRRSSSASTNYNSHGNSTIYTSAGHQQQSYNPTSQQSQVVIRRDVISEHHHNMSGGGKQSQP